MSIRFLLHGYFEREGQNRPSFLLFTGDIKGKKTNADILDSERGFTHEIEFTVLYVIVITVFRISCDVFTGT